MVINRYEVCGLLSEPGSVEVRNQEGAALALQTNSSNEIVAEPLDITIHAPADFTVTVNGVRLGAQHMTGQSEENESIDIC